MTQLQTPLTNLQQDAQKLTTALQQDLNPAMATGRVQRPRRAEGVQYFR